MGADVDDEVDAAEKGLAAVGTTGAEGIGNAGGRVSTKTTCHGDRQDVKEAPSRSRRRWELFRNGAGRP